MPPPATILDQILAHKREEVAAARRLRPLDEVCAAAKAAPPPRGFLAALTSGTAPRIIAECKRQSPSRGLMVPNYDPVALARAYVAGGAAAISVLTDERFFGGHLDHLRAVRAAVPIPVMRKDFIVDAYQVWEARAAGADAYLLLAGVLDQTTLNTLTALGRQLGMEPLIESHTATELKLALGSHGRVFGVNNRNLKDFSIDLGPARELFALANGRDPAAIMVCESGIHSRQDIEKMGAVGYKVFLIGEALATHPDPQAATRALID